MVVAQGMDILAGIVLIIGGTAGGFLFHLFDQSAAGNPLIFTQFRGMGHSVGQIRVQENIETGDSLFPQHLVGASADQDTGILGQLFDDLDLRVMDGVDGADISVHGIQEIVHEIGGFGHLLTGFVDLLQRIAALFRHFAHQVLVIIRNAQRFRQGSAQRLTVRAVFSADCNDLVF